MPGPATRLAKEAAIRARTAPERVARAAATPVEKAIKQRLVADIGSDRKFSNMGGKGAKSLTTKTTYTGSGRYSVATIEAKSNRGGWAILEHGTRGHSIRARRLRRGRSQAMRIGDNWATGPWRVSGVRARHTFTKGAKLGRPRAVTAGREAML